MGEGEVGFAGARSGRRVRGRSLWSCVRGERPSPPNTGTGTGTAPVLLQYPAARNCDVASGDSGGDGDGNGNGNRNGNGCGIAQTATYPSHVVRCHSFLSEAE